MLLGAPPAATASLGHPCAAVPPRGGAGRKRRGADAADDVLETARQLELLGPLGLDFGVPEGGFLADLQRSLHSRCVAAWDLPRARTALTWFAGFRAASPERQPFVPAIGSDALMGQAWNRMTLDLFGEFIRRSKPLSKAKADHVSADAVSSYVSVVHLIRSREARYEIAPKEVNLNMPLAFRSMRREDGPPGERKLGRALRAEHLADAAPFFDRRSEQGAIDWAAAVVGHNLLLRGGEVGIPDGIEIDLRRVIAWVSLEWQHPRRESRSRLWLFVRVVPIKDPDARRPGYPSPIARRHDGPFGSDPLCAYDALALAWWLRRGSVGVAFPTDGQGRPADGWWLLEPRGGAPAPSEPFFTKSGLVYTTSDVRSLIRRIATLAHLPEEDFGAKALRAGGATDLRAFVGEASSGVVRQRGRWCSDVAEIYQRPLVGTHLDASAAVGSVASADLEALCERWAQPTFR
jgi:hypothetical protein